MDYASVAIALMLLLLFLYMLVVVGAYVFHELTDP